MRSATFKMLVGAIAGLLVWFIMEPLAPKDIAAPEWDPYQLHVVIALGFAIGLLLGGLTGWLQGSKVHLLRGLVLGGVLGAIGASMGAGVGTRIAHAIFGEAVFSNVLNPIAPFARILGLTPIGTFLGLAIGASSLNGRRAVQGLIGGTLGAGIGAALFDPLGMAFAAIILGVRGANASGQAEVGMVSRAVFYLLMGGGIGLFIGLIEQVTKTAWLRLVLGRGEGKEWILDAPNNCIGRSETVQIPLFGDSAVAPVHACISNQGGAYTLTDMGAPGGTSLNGHPVSQAPLFHGAVIQVGGFRLEFLMKVGSAPQKAAEALRAQQHYALQGQAQPVAPFAGVPIAVPMPFQQPGVNVAPYAPTPVVAQPVSPQPSANPAALVVISGPLAGQRFAVNSVLEAGREGKDVGMAFDPSASRKHASFAPSPGGIVLNDLGSTNGTFVNDQRVQAATLVKGDLVRIGATTFRVE
jgi:pSer/pThr/pTyr-binding forkhead associated (FHA) protein